MLSLDAALRIPSNISFSMIGEDAFLLNTRTNKYFRLELVGTRLWDLISRGESLRNSHRIILDEYQVQPGILEKDLLQLVGQLLENGLVELV